MNCNFVESVHTNWPTTDKKQLTPKFEKQLIWRINLFEDGDSIGQGRNLRCSERRRIRRGQRITLLQELFDNEMRKVDPKFFKRRSIDRGDLDDPTHGLDGSVDDPDDYFKRCCKKYPTIYHLRKHIAITDVRPDIRLFYLAVRNIIEHRGHFLFEGMPDDRSPNLGWIMDRTLTYLCDEFEIDMHADGIMSDVESTLLDRGLRIKDKRARLYSLLSADDVPKRSFLDLLIGRTVRIVDIFGDRVLNDIEISLKGQDYDDDHDRYEDILGTERMVLLDLMKLIYDWSTVREFTEGGRQISSIIVDRYEQYEKDMKILRDVSKKFLSPKEYVELFKSDNVKNNHRHYTGTRKKSDPNERTCTQEKFNRYLKETFEDVEAKDPYLKYLQWRTYEGSFAPKRRPDLDNVIPNCMHRRELEKIVENMSRFYPFLNEDDGSGMSKGEKIILLCTFRIPYNIGSTDITDWSWTSSGKDVAVSWTSESITDLEKCSRGFIDNICGRCTYLPEEKALPNDSVLYSRCKLYDELNGLRVNGNRINPEMKMELVNGLFCDMDRCGRRVTVKDIRRHLASKGLISENDRITGVDGNVRSDLRSEMLIKSIIGERSRDLRMVEDIIHDVAVHYADGCGSREMIARKHSDRLTDDEINRLSELHFSGWGKLSERMLTEVRYPKGSPFEGMNLIDALERTNLNMDELLNDRYGLLSKTMLTVQDTVTVQDDGMQDNTPVPAYPNDMRIPKIWGCLYTIDSILKMTGCDLTGTVIETEDNRVHSGSSSRKEFLLKLYGQHIDDDRDWVGEISKIDEDRLHRRKVFAYYMQKGHCIYCNRPIHLERIDEEDYNMDHIIPRSLLMDDDIDTNMALTHKECNQRKSNTYPVSPDIQRSMRRFWLELRNEGFITAEKYDRLTRMTSISEMEFECLMARGLTGRDGIGSINGEYWLHPV